MRMNMDVIRSMMIDLVDRGPTGLNTVREPEGKYHAWLLLGAGLARGGEIHAGSAIVVCATAKGQEFVALARSQARWDRVRERLAPIGGSAPWETWIELLTDEMRKEVERRSPEAVV